MATLGHDLDAAPGVEQVHNEPERVTIRFFSADWTPWPVPQRLQQQWAELSRKVQLNGG